MTYKRYSTNSVVKYSNDEYFLELTSPICQKNVLPLSYHPSFLLRQFGGVCLGFNLLHGKHIVQGA